MRTAGTCSWTNSAGRSTGGSCVSGYKVMDEHGLRRVRLYDARPPHPGEPVGPFRKGRQRRQGSPVGFPLSHGSDLVCLSRWAPSSLVVMVGRQIQAEKRGPGRPREERVTRVVLDAVLSLVTEQGMDAVTMDAVASRAEVSKPAIYRRWPTKQDLILAAAESR